jgi:hypothetical protein
MFEPFWRKVVVAGCVSLLGLAVAAWSPSIGQDKKTEKPKTSASKKEKEVKGQLPAYFKDVVNDEQKTKIYGIQAKYRPQIEDLQDQLEALRKKQSDEIDAVLTKEQLDKVAAQRDAAAAAKKKKKDDAKKTDAAAKTETK